MRTGVENRDFALIGGPEILPLILSPFRGGSVLFVRAVGIHFDGFARNETGTILRMLEEKRLLFMTGDVVNDNHECTAPLTMELRQLGQCFGYGRTLGISENAAFRLFPP